jgi:dimethylargininase
MLVAMTRGVSSSIGDCQLTHLTRQQIDVEKAISQHRAYEECLRQVGMHVISLPVKDDLPDSVFVEDPAIVLDELALIGRMGAAKRRREAESLMPVLSAVRPLRFIDPPATLEGGDRVRIGRTLFVGVSSRTNMSGVEQLQDILRPFDYEVKPVEVTGCLHLSTGCSYLGDHTLIMNPDWIDASPFSDYDLIPTPPEEPWAANTMVIGDGVLLVSASFPRTRALLEERGFAVKVANISELEKAEAGLSCMSLIFDCHESALPQIQDRAR